MNLKHFLLTALCVVATVGAKAQDWTWVGETPTNGGNFYIYHPVSQKFLNHQNKTGNNLVASPSIDDAFVWNVNINSSTDGVYTVNLSSNGLYFNLAKGTFSSVNPNLSNNLETTQISKSGTNTNINAYKIRRTADPARYLNYNSSSFTAANNTGEQNDWLFISEAQMEAYKKYIAGETNINMTFAIANPGAETNDGWTFDEGGRYIDSNIAHSGSRVFETAGWWSYTTHSVRQTVTNIPNGYYTLSTWRMAGTNATCTLTGNDASATSIGTGDQGDDKWQQMSLITKVTDGNLQIEASSNSPSGVDEKTTWANFDDFSLSYLGNASASMAVNAAAKYGTFCAPFAVTVPSGVEASTATLNGNGSTIDLTSVGATIPANTPVILYAENGLAATTLYGAAVAGTPTEGNLTGVYTATMAQDGWYVLQNNDNKVGFYRVHSGSAHPTVGANRCYLTTSGNEARAFFFDEETAISAIEALTTGTAEIYSLDGTKTSSLRKGVNIIRLTNGKTQKVIVK